MLYKISTPDADEYKEIFIEEDSGIVISPEKYCGRLCKEVISDFTSVWKLYSSVYKDNVYPTVEIISASVT